MLSSDDVAKSIIHAVLAPNNVVQEEVVIRRTGGDFKWFICLNQSQSHIVKYPYNDYYFKYYYLNQSHHNKYSCIEEECYIKFPGFARIVFLTKYYVWTITK